MKNKKECAISNNENNDLLELKKERGKRLKICRELRGLSQRALEHKAGYGSIEKVKGNYISMLERGDRLIDWDKAKLFADILNVNPAYIMGDCPTIKNGYSLNVLDLDTYGLSDKLLIKFLMAAGHDIIFHVVDLNDGKQPIKKYSNLFNKYYDDWDSLLIDASIDDLEKFCLSDNHCELIKKIDNSDETILFNVLIQFVTIDGYKMPYSLFVFSLKRFYDYIDFTLSSLKDYSLDYDVLIQQDELAKKEIEASRNLIGGVLPNGLTPEENLIQVTKDLPHVSVKMGDETKDNILIDNENDLNKLLGLSDR